MNKTNTNTNTNKTQTTKLKYTGFDKFKYDNKGVYRFHPSKLKSAIQLDLEHRIQTGQINLFITLNPNIKGISIGRLEKIVRWWEYLVTNRVLNGKQRNTVNKYAVFGFIEDGATHQTRHMHLLVQVPTDRLEWFERMVYKMWRKACKSGSANVQRIDKETSKELTQYVLKDIDYAPDDSQNFDKNALDRMYVG